MRIKEVGKKSRPLRRWLILQSVRIVILSVMTFLLVEFFINIVMGRNPGYEPIDGIGMIVPMGVLMYVLSYNIMKKISKYLNELIESISRVASGAFSVRMDEKSAGPVKELYANFNKMTADLESVQTLRDDFINHFSHEFRTPITSINGFANLLLEESVTMEEQKEYLGIIASESEGLSKLSESALLLTKLESQHFIFNSESYQLDEQLRECAILLMPQMTRKEINLSTSLPPVRYIGNTDLMKHIWMNILGNAVKYSNAGGVIDIELKEESSTAVVSISDSGPGMSEQTVNHAFEKYYQDESGVKQRGLGLGLSIVKKIVDLCAGRIEVTSTPGKGSCFTVYLSMRA